MIGVYIYYCHTLAIRAFDKGEEVDTSTSKLDVLIDVWSPEGKNENEPEPHWMFFVNFFFSFSRTKYKIIYHGKPHCLLSIDELALQYQSNQFFLLQSAR